MAGSMTREEIQQNIIDLGPWFYEFDFGDGLKTNSAIPATVTQIFDTRLQMVNEVLDSHFGGRLTEISSIDVGCHEGFYSIAMAKKGVARITGVDVRETACDEHGSRRRRWDFLRLFFARAIASSSAPKTSASMN